MISAFTVGPGIKPKTYGDGHGGDGCTSKPPAPCDQSVKEIMKADQ